MTDTIDKELEAQVDQSIDASRKFIDQLTVLGLGENFMSPDDVNLTEKEILEKLDQIDKEVFTLQEQEMILQMPRKTHPKANGYRSQITKLNLRKEMAHHRHKQKDGDEEDSCDEHDAQSHEKFLVWEPQKAKDKIFSLFTNITESIFVTVVAAAAIVHSSLVAIGFFLVANLFFISSTMDQGLRWSYGKAIIGFNMFVVFAVSIWKFIKVDDMVFTPITDHSLFKKDIAFYESLGFSLEYNVNDLDDPNKESWTYNYYPLASFGLEIFLTLLLVLLFVFMNRQQKRFKFLTACENQDIIQRYVEKTMTDAMKDDEEDGVPQKLDLGSKKKLRKDPEVEEQERIELENLEKKISKSFVDNDYFYQLNQYFYMGSIVFQLFQSMAFNNCADVPILFMLLILCSLFAFRKDITHFYRNYSFVVIYFIQFVLSLKIINEVLLRIDFANQFFLTNKDYTVVKVNTIIFGGVYKANLSPQDVEDMQKARFWQYVYMMCCLLCCQSWKACKWVEIRYKTSGMREESSMQRFKAYMNERARQDYEQKILQNRKEFEQKTGLQMFFSKVKQISQKKKKKSPFDTDVKDKQTSDNSKHLPGLMLNIARLQMFMLTYLYHVHVSIIHLCWVILSFMVSRETILTFSIVGMIPLLSWEFVLIYGSRLPVIQDSKFFTYYGDYFKWNMNSRVYEQTLMFSTLAVFFTMMSSYKIHRDTKMSNKQIIYFFKERIDNPQYSHWWQVLFICLRYVQTLVLLALFFNGIRRLNNFQNMCYMLFFIIYTAYEEIYRATGKILIFFISFFILGQYIFSFSYTRFMKDTNKLIGFQWVGLIPPQNTIDDPFDFEGKTTMYWKLRPQIFDWTVLLMMWLLNGINQMFKYKNDINKLTEICQKKMKQNYSKTAYYMQRVQNIVKGLIVYALMIFMILIHTNLETNIINWVFFSLNMINLALIIRGTSTIGYVKQSINIINTIKIYSLFILILDIAFIILVGEMPKFGQPDSLDQRFNNTMPGLYANLDIIGFRSNELKYSEIRTMAQDKVYRLSDANLRKRFIGYTEFFLISIYLSYHFNSLLRQKEAEMDFNDNDYKKIFEWKSSKDAHDSSEDSDDVYLDPLSKNESGIFHKKRYYGFQDLIDFYERQRFTLPFMVYRFMRFWPILDFFALYGHVINNLIIVYMAINWNISVFMCFNIFCVCYFYMIACQRLNNRANKNAGRSGVLSQCDLKMAQLITKRFKNDTFYEFLSLRSSIWNLQFFVLILCSVIGFPTAILYHTREKLILVDPVGNADMIQNINNYSFWIFIGGFYQDQRADNIQFFRFTIAFLILGLIAERQAINWLKDRFGCTHFKLQKFIELDQRREALRYNWDIQNPAYNLERYRPHYYYNDYDEVIKKIRENKSVHVSESHNHKTFDEFGRPFIGDFVPYKVGLRMLRTIKFVVLLECRAPELKLDDATRQILDQNGELDYESIPVLKDYKIKFLHDILTQAVDRKYKISFTKGVQIMLEAIIQLILMASIVMKSNIFSLFYLVFVYKLITSATKTQTLVRINAYMSVCFALQYLFFLLNLTQVTNPQPFPPSFENYPQNKEDPSDLTLDYPIPWFFRYEQFQDLRVSYLLGIGIDTDQVQNLILDFVNIYLVSMYIMNFRNPILVRSMTKVFWQFPSPSEAAQWKRLKPEVQRQVMWLFNPKSLWDHDKSDQYVREQSNYKGTTLSPKQIENAKGQYEFALEYQKQNLVDLNYILTNYVDLKYPTIWSEEFLKQKKWEIKDNSSYFRIVKQGSQLVYVTFHIFTIFLVLLMATMRQSVISIGYVLILLPRMKDGSEVLDQRNIHQNSSKNKLEEEIEELDEKIQNAKRGNEDIDEDELEELEQTLKEKRQKLLKLIKKSKVSFKQNQEEKKKQAQKQWSMIKVIQVYLIIYGMLDFTSQIVFQMPMIQDVNLQAWGLRKVWQVNSKIDTEKQFSYSYMIKSIGDNDPSDTKGLNLNWINFGMQLLNCVIICIISAQTEIFNSPGYVKYVTQTGGSMDLLVSLAELKAKSITYRFNNNKIRKIISIQRKKEAILATVEKLKEKLQRWRAFTRTTLVNLPKPEVKGEELMKEFERFEKLKNQKEPSSALSIDKKSSLKTVGFPEEEEKEKEQKEMEQVAAAQITTKLRQISPEDARLLQQKLAKEFVKAKQQKMRMSVRLYIWLNRTFTTQIMFKNKEDQLKELVRQHAEGEVYIPTELESIMQVEAEEIIRHHYDHLEGRQELTFLVQRSKGKTGASLLQMTGFDKKIKLQDMQKTWDFTRPLPMVIRYLETFFYIIISQTQNLIYLAMLMSMYQNAGIISIFYPIAVFGYALLEETRPRNWFWNMVRTYTTILLFFKFIMNLSFLEEALAHENFLYWESLLKIGLYDYTHIGDLIQYMMPEILIISLIMLNEIKLKLLGLYFEIEQDYESVLDGIQRNIENGDEQKVLEKKIQSQNMNMARYFEPLYEQQKLLKEFDKIMLDEIEAELEAADPMEMEQKYQTPHINEQIQMEFKIRMPDVDAAVKQQSLLKEISQQVNKASRQFDLDSTQTTKESPFDRLVKENVLQKCLEDDSLLYVEGIRNDHQPDFLTAMEFQEEALKKENHDDCISAGDFEEAFEEKFDMIDEKGQEQPDFFERRDYFDKIFPSLKIQKPGYDLYGCTTTILFILAVFVFMNFQEIVVDPSIFKFYQGQTSIFKGEMAIALLTIIAVIVVERYTSRIDTKAPTEDKRLSTMQAAAPAGSSGSFFSQEDIFKRTSTNRSMTVKLQTMKTSDLDMQGNAAQDFLKQMYDNEDGNSSFDESRTKITRQQKLKFIMHWTILIVCHMLVFWFFPIRGNFQLYESPICDAAQEEFYGCRNFHKSPTLRTFYILICIYLVCSCLQLSYGYPIMKKPSSVLQYYNPVANIGGIIYTALPFVAELRAILDFTMSKTSLDMFQFLQLWQYHYELYAAKNGNYYYTWKQIGIQTDKIEKCTTGLLISALFLILLAGPLLLFSEYGGLTQANPIIGSQFEIAFQLNKTIPKQADGTLMTKLPRSTVVAIEKAVNAGTMKIPKEAIHTSVNYKIFGNANGVIRNYDTELYEKSEFASWTETTVFTPEQVQDSIMSDFSDRTWDITGENEELLKNGILQSVNMPDHGGSLIANVSLALNYRFTRKAPDTAKTATGMFFKTLNYSNYHDCQTGLQLQKFAELNCTNPKDADGKTKFTEIYFTQAYDPYLILGQSAGIKEVIRDKLTTVNQKHDIRIKYTCDRTWNVQAMSQPTIILEKEVENQSVDPYTCKPINPTAFNTTYRSIDEAKAAGLNEENQKLTEIREDLSTPMWQSLKVTLFSVFVSASILASYSPSTFYGGVVYLVSGIIRPIFLYGTWKGWIYETTNPDAIIKCVECVYMKRHEEDLVGEEESYRILQEIVRCPELFKAITGSSLRGSADPALDKLSEKDRKKLENLTQLERKGFDVEKLKEKLLKGTTDDKDMMIDA